jgi:SAM-dependent methyltransferase
MRQKTKVSDFSSINWNDIWHSECLHSHWNKTSQPGQWDKRAAIFGREQADQENQNKDNYISLMLNRIEVKSDWNVLDIGCGSGVLTIPIAKKAKSLTALDISPGMLDQLKTTAALHNLNNIQYVHNSWQEAIKNSLIGKYDLIIASRSLMTADLQDGLSYIVSNTGCSAYLTFPIVHLPFDFEVYSAIGIDGKNHPNYIIAYGMLYKMGIQGNMEIMRSRIKVRYSNLNEAEEQLKLRLAPLTASEMESLHCYLVDKYNKSKVCTDLIHEGYSEFALIWWQNTQQGEQIKGWSF